VEIDRQGFQDAPQDAGVDPGLKAAVTGLIRRIAAREILPRRAGPEDPEDPVQHVAGIAPRPSAAIAAQTGFRQKGRQNGPLRVCEIHAVEYDGDRNFVHHPMSGFMR
jgi:hypothetical protein